MNKLRIYPTITHLHSITFSKPHNKSNATGNVNTYIYIVIPVRTEAEGQVYTWETCDSDKA